MVRLTVVKQLHRSLNCLDNVQIFEHKPVLFSIRRRQSSHCSSSSSGHLPQHAFLVLRLPLFARWLWSMLTATFLVEGCKILKKRKTEKFFIFCS
jgi:hypothetical protein